MPEGSDTARGVVSVLSGQSRMPELVVVIGVWIVFVIDYLTRVGLES